MNNVIAAICTQANLQLSGFESVHGGDINEAYKIKTSNGVFFLKLNDANRFPAMFEKEAEGLKALRGKSDLVIPEVISHGFAGTHQYLLLEWMQKSQPGNQFWNAFALALAMLHKNTSENFGWQNDNYIGSLTQSNRQHEQWSEFYATQRILPLCKQLFDTGAFTKADIANAESLSNKLDGYFPAEKPSLVHGDLWSGNFMITGPATAALFDPAVYYGHREMDIGLAKLFGGFDASFFNHYQECFPMEKKWILRLPITQLYPLLVHAVLFGGGYINRCRNILKVWH